MREEIIRCNECKGVIDGEVLNLPEMVVRRINQQSKEFPYEDIILVGRGATEKGKPPDFCGIPCMFKWITNKLTGGVRNGNQSE